MASSGGPVGTGVGTLRDRVTFLAPVRTAGPTGQPNATLTYAAQATVWARVEPAANVRDLVAHRQPIALGDLAVTARGGLDVRSDWQATWNGRTLEVVAVVRPATGLSNKLVVVCREQQPGTPNPPPPPPPGGA